MTFLFRKLTRKLIVLASVLAAIYLVFLYIGSEPLEYTNNKYKVEVIEDAINSFENQNGCQLPVLPVHSPEMLAFLKTEPPIQCDDTEAWVTCGTNQQQPWLCSIRDVITDRFGPISCDFQELVRPNDDFGIDHSPRINTKSTFKLKLSDFVKVKCWTDARSDRQHWSGILTGIRERNDFNTHKSQLSSEMPYNVIMYGFDSLSRNAFIRKLPRTYRYLTEHLHADVLQGYNIVGDGTPQAIISLLTGFSELELPETRKRIRDSGPVDVYPFIFKEYKRNGYVTAFNEDLPNVGTFSYRLNGFHTQPTDHYMRPFYLAFADEIKKHKPLCIGDVARHNVMFDYTSKFMRAYRNTQPQFAFSFHGELSHDSINLIGVADDDMTEWLQGLQSDGLLDRTILIVMSDHGNRFAAVRDTLQGKLEERLPFFSFAFPTSFKTKYSAEYAKFKTNLQRLTTPFDVHETLLNILSLQFGDDKVNRHFDIINSNNSHHRDRVKSRAISMFKLIPENRSCADAYIEPHWCSCLNLHFINTSTDIVKRAANAIVDRINNYTNTEHALCQRLKLTTISWAGKLIPHKTLIKFKQNRDLDGYLADLTSTTTKISKELYQLKIHVAPGDSIFEASLTHDLTTNQFSVDINHVSRINAYGAQANCILDKNPDLRKFCYCRNEHE